MALADLVSSDGWAMLLREVEREWGSDALLNRLSARIDGKSLTPGQSADELSKLLFGQQVLRRVLSWPVQELRRLGKVGDPVEKPVRSRRRRA